MCRDAGWRLQEEIDREQAEQGPAPSQEETGEVSRRHTLVININTHLYMFDKVQSARCTPEIFQTMASPAKSGISNF